MNDLVVARSQMGMSLAFHIIFAAIGIALPLMMVIAEWLWLRTGEETYHQLAKRWAKGAAVLFAVGAVSGTVLSFELGLLWPRFMRFAGEIIGLPFALEGFAFFTEAIFLGIYLYGWTLVPKKAHLGAGIIVALSGAASALFVVLANGWMNTPSGITMRNGTAFDINPTQAMWNPAGVPEAIHMLIAAYAATAFAMAGIHAFCMLKDKGNLFHRRALGISLSIGSVMAIMQPVSGDLLAQMVAHLQPVKLAALEAHFDTEAGAAISLGGVVNQDAGEIKYALKIPYVLSFLAFHDPHASVRGLKEFPKEHWPFVPVVHYCFQIMVACGGVMGLIGVWSGWHFLQHRTLPDSRRFLWAVSLSTPLGFLAIETGWLVTEMGRQPWIIQGIMLARDAVTPMPGLIVTFTSFALVYVFLVVITSWIIYSEVVRSPVITQENANAAPQN